MKQKKFSSNMVILYGSLRSGQKSFQEMSLHTKLTLLDTVYFTGALIDLGEYPGACLSIEGTIEGELYIVDDELTWEELDKFEMCDSSDRRILDRKNGVGSLYNRELVACKNTEGVSLGLAYVYEFNGEVVDGVRRSGEVVRSGNWVEHVSLRGT